MKSCCDAWHHQAKAVLRVFANGAFAADHPAKAGSPRVWGCCVPFGTRLAPTESVDESGIPIKFLHCAIL